MLLPIRTKNPPESIPFFTYGLIFLNIAIFGLTVGADGSIREEVATSYGVSMVNATPLTFLTHMFLHGDVFHLLGNLLFLWIFGRAVEGRLKTLKFAALYLIAGISGAALHLLMMKANIAALPLIGASGAIMGTMGAALYMFPHSPVTFFYLFFFRPGTVDWALWGAALYYLFWDVLGAAMNLSGIGGTAHLAHLGGVAAGFFIPMILRAPRDDEYVSDTKALMHEVKDYSILTPMQLGELAKTQPDNVEIALAWAFKSLQSTASPIKPECMAHFTKHINAIIRGADVSQMGMTMALLSSQPGRVHSGYVLNAGTRLEKAGQPQIARQLFENIRRDPSASEQDLESATFWLGSVYEQWLNQLPTALSLYAEFLQKWPMSPMAAQVQARHASLTGRL